MTELELYKYLTDKGIETRILHWYEEKDDMSDLTDENWDEWRVLIFPMVYQLDEFCRLLGEGMLDEEGIEVHLKYRYLAIDLMPIMDSCGIDPKNIFPRKE